MPDIEQYCERAILLDHGTQRFIGSSSEAAKHYYLLHQAQPQIVDKQPLQTASRQGTGHNTSVIDRPPPEAFIDLTDKLQISNGQARCVSVALCNEAGHPCNNFRQGERAVFYYEFELIEDIEVPICGILITNERGVIVHGKNSLQYPEDVPSSQGAGSRVICQQEIMLDIIPGEYIFQVGLAWVRASDRSNRENISHDALDSRVIRVCHVPQVGSFSVGLGLKHGVNFLTHHGVANLPGGLKITTLPAGAE